MPYNKNNSRRGSIRWSFRYRISGYIDGRKCVNAHFTQAKHGKTPSLFRLRAANGLEIPYIGYAVLNLEVEGIKVTERGVVIVEDEKCTHPFVVGMNVIMACWDTLFKPCPVRLRTRRPGGMLLPPAAILNFHQLRMG